MPLSMGCSKLKARHLEWQGREKLREEQERQRREEEQRRIEEENKVKHLDVLLANWAKSHNIREFVRVIDQTLKDRNIEPTRKLSTWLEWARQYADSIDPILLTFPVNEADGAHRDKAEGESETR